MTLRQSGVFIFRPVRGSEVVVLKESERQDLMSKIIAWMTQLMFRVDAAGNTQD